MRNTRDEILYKMAAEYDDLDLSLPIPIPVPIPEVPNFSPPEEQKSEIDMSRFPSASGVLNEEEDPVSVGPSPIEVPPQEGEKKEEGPSLKDPTEEVFYPGGTEGEGPDPNAPKGSPEWYAYHNTREFLKGSQLRYRGQFREDPPLTRKTMDWLVKENPEDYFRWDLNRRHEFKPWLFAAGDSWIEKDPHSALLARVYKLPELRVPEFTTKMWDKLMQSEMDRAAETDTGEMFPGEFKRFMRQLAGVIAVTDPEFYKENIYGKPISSKQHDKAFELMMSRKAEMLESLVKLADNLDLVGEIELATELDDIIREMLS